MAQIDPLETFAIKKKATSNEVALSLELYVKRWQRWCAAGLQGIKIDEVYVYGQNLNLLNLSP
jgi:hypothetical protein